MSDETNAPHNEHTPPLTATNSTSSQNKNDDLPIIVWLKGDEPYFSDFSWDANEVMKVLSIKRSRLNQISGKELRVGKARIDHYIRPIYRPCDVKHYLSWTRPTASHKRSSTIIEEARQKLEDKTDDLISKMSDSSKDALEDVKITIRNLLFEQFGLITHQLKELSNTLPEQLNALTSYIHTQLHLTTKSLSSVEEKTNNQEKKLDHIEYLFNELQKAILQLEQYESHFTNLKTQLNTQYENDASKQHTLALSLDQLSSKIETLIPKPATRTTVEKYRSKQAYLPKFLSSANKRTNLTTLRQTKPSRRHSLAIQARKTNKNQA